MKRTTYTLSGTTFLVPEVTFKTPISICLKSADATRKIELSFDGGTEYFVPPYDFSSATALVLAMVAPAKVRVTGVTNDTVTVLQDN